jgi:hypothetical protein
MPPRRLARLEEPPTRVGARTRSSGFAPVPFRSNLPRPATGVDDDGVEERSAQFQRRGELLDAERQAVPRCATTARSRKR